LQKVAVIALGEVGSAIYEIIKDSGKYELYGYDVDPQKTKNKLEEIPEGIDFMHIAVPFKDKKSFVGIVTKYFERLKPKYVIIHSSVAPGTTRMVQKNISVPVAYSPVRGKHPNLKRHILLWNKWVSVIPENSGEEIINHLKSLGLKVKVYDGKPETLELAKLLETVYRALLIAWWQEMHRIARHFGADIATVTEFIAEVNRVLKDRPIYYPGFIGGHCLIPNTRILLSEYDSDFLKAILKSNELRAKELEDESIKKEIEKIKEIALEFINKDYFRGNF